MLARCEISMRGCAALGLLAMAISISGCAAQLAAEVPDAAPAERATQRPIRPTDAPPSDQTVAETPRDAAPGQANEPTTTPATTPEPQQNQPDQVATEVDDGREYRTVFYRADARQPATMPPVMLSEGHQALCRVKVGDTMPDIELDQLGGGRRRLTELAGKTATVVIFWKSDRRMAQQQLADVRPDVIEPFADAGVTVVGIAVEESPANIQAALERAGADFPQLLDTDGKAFAQVGNEKLPRTYLLDPQGKILWFDIEYSLSTRRELHQALRALVEKP